MLLSTAQSRTLWRQLPASALFPGGSTKRYCHEGPNKACNARERTVLSRSSVLKPSCLPLASLRLPRIDSSDHASFPGNV